jgi:hypothetical protein
MFDFTTAKPQKDNRQNATQEQASRGFDFTSPAPAKPQKKYTENYTPERKRPTLDPNALVERGVFDSVEPMEAPKPAPRMLQAFESAVREAPGYKLLARGLRKADELLGFSPPAPKPEFKPKGLEWAPYLAGKIVGEAPTVGLAYLTGGAGAAGLLPKAAPEISKLAARGAGAGLTHGLFRQAVEPQPAREAIPNIALETAGFMAGDPAASWLGRQAGAFLRPGMRAVERLDLTKPIPKKPEPLALPPGRVGGLLPEWASESGAIRQRGLVGERPALPMGPGEAAAKEPWEMVKESFKKEVKPVYHGTRSGIDFDVFDPLRSQDKAVIAWVTPSKKYAEAYGRVKKFDIRTKNILDLTRYTKIESGDLKRRTITEWLDIFKKKGIDAEVIDKRYIGDSDRYALWDLLDGRDVDVTDVTNLSSKLKQSKYDAIKVYEEYQGKSHIAIGLLKPELELSHRQVVEKALSEGKPVPPEVLKDYPELQGKTIQSARQIVEPVAELNAARNILRQTKNPARIQKIFEAYPELKAEFPKLVKKLEKVQRPPTPKPPPAAPAEAGKPPTPKTVKTPDPDTPQGKLYALTGVDIGKVAKRWTDKAKLLLKRETPERNFEAVMGKDAPEMIKKFLDPVHKSESDRIRWLEQERAEIKTLGIKARSKESELVQKYGEGLINEGQLRTMRPGDWQKIKTAADTFRQKYDKYLDDINAVLTRNGYDPIPKRKDYFRHFEDVTSLFEQYGIPRRKLEDLPTDINGITMDFKPGKNFFASALRRKGNKTTYDAITGIDGYLEGASRVIYHTDNIQRLRALEKASEGSMPTPNTCPTSPPSWASTPIS